MKRVWITLAVLCVAFAALGWLVLHLVGERLGRGTPVAAPAVVTIDLEGPIVERFAPDPFVARLEPARHDLLGLVRAIRGAARDERVEGILLRVGVPGYGWAKAEEIRDQLRAFRATGKFVVAYLTPTDELGYYVALAADRIYLLPDGALELNGFRAEAPFLQETFEKIGLVAQVENVGAYKTAADMLRRQNMSDEDREVTGAILRERYERFVAAVTESRRVDEGAFRKALDRGTYLAADLRRLGLVDGELYEGQVRDLVVRRAAQPERPLGELEAALAAGRRDGSEASPVADDHLVPFPDYLDDVPPLDEAPGAAIALVYAVGAITGGDDGVDPLFGRTLGAASTTETLRAVAADGRLSAVVLRIDSPGGDAYASEEIWAEVERLSASLPVVVSMSDVAGSGGYYIAAAADELVASPSTVTGSIGVLAVIFDASEAWRKLGVAWDVVATNEAAGFPTTTRPLTETERETFRTLVRDIYRGFVARVAQGRRMTTEQIDAVAQGRVWSGTQALERGLVDRVGGLDVAIAAAKELAGIDSAATVGIVVYPREASFLERIAALADPYGSARARPRGAGAVPRAASAGAAAVPILRDAAQTLTGAAAALREGPGRPLTVMPSVPRIR